MSRGRMAVALGSAVAAVASALLVTASTASTATASGRWQEYHSSDVTYPADRYCGFEVQGTVLEDHEFVRTFETYPDGSPKVQEIVGPLVMSFTNTETGKSVERDISGIGRIEYHTDGTQKWYLTGRVAVGVRPGDHVEGTVPHHQGIYVVHERGTLTFHADGTRTLWEVGPVESLCDTLAAG